jgi:hypothetical protein
MFYSLYKLKIAEFLVLGSCGLVVMTSALHAEDHGFDPRHEYIFYFWWGKKRLNFALHCIYVNNTIINCYFGQYGARRIEQF